MELGTHTTNIIAALAIIVSYGLNLLARKTHVPSVLMLILLGVLIKVSLNLLGVEVPEFASLLELLGTFGLILIVLEGALDLELRRKKWQLIWKSFLVALLGFVICTLAIAYVLQRLLETEYVIAVLYAMPLSILSSAIIIPSVSPLDEHRKEFMIYEGSFSDIIGIMAFYFLLEHIEGGRSGLMIGVFIGGKIILTLLLSLILSYLLIVFLQRVKGHSKLFLTIAILVGLYSCGKLFHISSLLIIMVFGLLLRNAKLFFVGPLKKYANVRLLTKLYRELRTITIESSFVVRTFFFLLFGVSLSLAEIVKWEVFFVSLILLVIIYASRIGLFKVIEKKNIMPQIFIAPRGLITILLFFAIPEQYKVDEFEPGILLFIIISSSIFMAWAMIKYNRQHKLTNANRVEGGASRDEEGDGSDILY